MKVNKLFVLALSMPLLLTGLTSCNSHKAVHEEFIKSLDKTGLDYLYEVTYHDYNWGDVSDWMESDAKNNDGAGFGCSSVHIGNFYGRSFDFCITDMCEFLVRTNHESGHYASLGIAIADCKLNEEKVEKINKGDGDEEEKLYEKMLPFTMVDGINENGVVCNTNVVPAKDLTPHEGEEKYHTHGTNPGKEDLFYQFMPRFILDNAKSAAHAVELLKNRNITSLNKKGEVRDYLGVNGMGYELHCMIADKNDTYIIELYNDKMSIIPGHIMTNYYLTEATPSGAGWERYQVLYNRKKNPNDSGETAIDVKSIDDMKKLIQYVQYSPCYDSEYKDIEGNNCAMWPSEFAGCDIVDQKGVPSKLTFYNAERWCWDHWEDGKVNLKDQLSNVYNEIQTKLADPSKRTSELGGKVPWISTHAEAYDIEKKELYLVTQEKMKNDKYDFQLFKL